MKNIFELLKKRKKIIKDFALGFCSSFVTVGVTQLLLYPLLASIFDAEQYGEILSIMGVANTIVATIGGSLNNTRLIVENEYTKQEKKGDFIPMIIIGSIIGSIIEVIYLLFEVKLNIIVFMGIAMFVFIASIRNYADVYFRIKLDYRKIMICSTMVAAGNLIGVMLLFITKNKQVWFLAFLIGEVIGIFYILLYSDMRKDIVKYTSRAPRIIHIEVALLLSTFISNVLTYLDRFMLMPALGGEAVSLYTTASFLGKSFGVIIIPLSGVLLSYYSQQNFNMNTKKYWKINIFVAIISVPAYLICVILARPITGLFYPTLVKGAYPYMAVANGAAIINALANMTQPAVLKYAKTYWQVILQIVYSVIYLLLGYIGIKREGLYGFCIAAILAAVIRLVLLYTIGNQAIRGKAE